MHSTSFVRSCDVGRNFEEKRLLLILAKAKNKKVRKNTFVQIGEQKYAKRIYENNTMDRSVNACRDIYIW